MAPLEFLLPASSGLQLERLVVLSNQILLFVHATQLFTTCPNCHRPSIQQSDPASVGMWYHSDGLDSVGVPKTKEQWYNLGQKGVEK